MFEAAVRWAQAQLGVRNLTLVRTRPWATVWISGTGPDAWWLKVSAPGTSYEPRLLHLLQALGASLAPDVIAHPDQPWVLVADAGRPAREALEPGTGATDFWCELLAGYAELQQSVPRAALVDAGVPDASPAALPALLEQLLAEPVWLDPGYAPDVSDADRERVLGCGPALRSAAGRLADGIPATLQHDDLHGGNVFIRDGKVTVIDWGDACLAHPFGTLLVTLRSLAAEWGCAPDAPELRRVQSAYLEAWRTRGESSIELDRQLDLALRTGCLARAAGWRRALGTPDAGVELGFADGVAYWLVQTARSLDEGTAPTAAQR